MNRLKDIDLREALARREAQRTRPEVPADFCDAVMQKIVAPHPQPSPSIGKRLEVRGESHSDGVPSLLSPLTHGEGTRKGREGLKKVMGWVASFLLIIGIGSTMLYMVQPKQTAPLVAKTEKHNPVPKQNTSEQPTTVAATTPSAKPYNRKTVQPQNRITVQPQNRTTAKPQKQKSLPEEQTEQNPTPKVTPFQPVCDALSVYTCSTQCDPTEAQLHYALCSTQTDTVPYQDPARVDEFIAKFANYYNVKQAELQCSAPQDSNVISAVYVFPDKKEVDVFGRMLQAAVSYSDETPGYFLNFSHQQLFFELKDMRKQLQYRWIAERINGKILLYSICSPIETLVSSACYQEYREELMHARSINTKTL
ncbi:MAG: hypothetical protein IJT97_06650 [Bacteroidaceae bacterium]|nr:hypothetical protein [Bacteroidaceae bacterium]